MKLKTTDSDNQHETWIHIREALRVNTAARLPGILPLVGCRPIAANLRLTHRCGGRCKTCTHWFHDNEGVKELSTAEWKKILESLKAQQIQGVSFTGGDILKRNDAIELMEYAASLNLKVEATLNGFRMTKQTARRLMAARPTELRLSIDSLGETFDTNRGIENATGKVLETLHLLRIHNTGTTRLGLAVTLMRDSLEGARKVVLFGLEQGLAVQFNLILFTHYFTDTQFSREQYELTAAQMKQLNELIAWLIDLRSIYSRLLPPKSNLLWIVKYFEDYRQQATPCLKTMLKPCIEPDGSVRPCCSMEPVGNIRSSPLSEITCSSEYLRVVRNGLEKNCPGCSCHYSLSLGANIVTRSWFDSIHTHGIVKRIKTSKIFNPVRRGFCYIRASMKMLREILLGMFDQLHSRQITESFYSHNSTIMFQSYSVHHAYYFEAIIQRLRERDVTIFFQILDHPHFKISERNALRNFVQERLGIPADQIFEYPDNPGIPIDLLVCADVYARFSSNIRRTCIIFHGPTLPLRNFKYRPFRKTLYDFHKVIPNGEYDFRLINKYGGKKMDDFEAVVGGCPFLDLVATPSRSRTSHFQRLGLDPDKKTVLVAPSWSGLTLCKSAGASYIEDIVKVLQPLPLNLIVKPHVCSFNAIMAGGVDWHTILMQLESRGLVRVDREIDDRPSLCHADILITDTSSRAFSFMMLGKPVILYYPVAKPIPEWEKPRQELLERGSMVAETLDDIPKYAEQACRNQYQNPEALEIAADCLAHVGHSTDFVSDRLVQWAREAGMKR